VRNYLRDRRKAMTAPLDPVVDLRRAWDIHIDFGLSHPGCYRLIYGQPDRGKMGSAANEAIAIMRQAPARTGMQGRLCMSVERATRLLHASAVGFAVTQIGIPPGQRDQELSLVAHENVLRSMVNDDAQPSAVPELPGRASALREALRGHPDLPMTSVEGAMLAEWLDRLAGSDAGVPITDVGDGVAR
jgi:hypothetical protein